MKHLRRQRLIRALAVCLALASPVAIGGGLSHAATVMPTANGLTLKYMDESGAARQETIPVYHAGTVKYFSAGVGLEERSAHYPPFPLKLIFVAGPRAYVSQVSVTITDTEGKVRLQVPREQVTGPWLFVDLPPGTYDITAEGPGKAQVKERVTISTKEGKTVYMRWEGESS
jgi:hypothetical protein